jgi:hypothetical protein
MSARDNRTQAGEMTMFTRTTSYTLGIALLSLLLCFAARAQKIEVSTGVFCDTQKQVERLVALFDGNAEKAMTAVNAEENDPTAWHRWHDRLHPRTRDYHGQDRERNV